jgi:hypothetical protein
MKKLCKCGAPAKSKGLCQKCYNAIYKSKKPKKVCKICGGAYFSKDLCHSHYRKMRLELGIEKTTTPKYGTCQNCNKENIRIAAKGLCSYCYYVSRYKKLPTYCRICGELAFKQYYCELHYAEYKEEQILKINEKRKKMYLDNRDQLLEKSKAHHALHKEEYNERAKKYNKKKKGL